MTIAEPRHSAATTQPSPALPDRVLVAVIAGATKIGVVLDADAAVSVQLAALVDLVSARLDELAEPPLTAGPRGRWTLCWVDGTALKSQLSLASQGVVDGTRLWLRFVADSEARINVIEHVTSAVARELDQRWAAVTPVWAGRVGAGMVVAGVLTAAALLGRWRYGHLGWVPAVYGGGLALALIVAAVIILARETNNSAARGVGDALLVTGCVPAGVAAAAAVPGPVGAPTRRAGAGGADRCGGVDRAIHRPAHRIGYCGDCGRGRGRGGGVGADDAGHFGADSAHGAAVGIGRGYACGPDRGAPGRRDPAAGVPVGFGPLDLSRPARSCRQGTWWPVAGWRPWTVLSPCAMSRCPPIGRAPI